jgi:hypothetical protein
MSNNHWNFRSELDLLSLAQHENIGDGFLTSVFEASGYPSRSFMGGGELMGDMARPLSVSVETRSYNPVWQRAEDSFLSFFCEISRHPWGSTYYWEKGQDWPKFNFLRLTDPNLTGKQFDELCRKFQPWFTDRKRTFNIKIPSDVAISSSVMDRLKWAESALVSLRYSSSVIAPKNKGITLHRCQSVEDLKEWWDINSDGRTRENQQESPLWPIIVDAFRKGTQYYFLRLDGVSVSGGAFTPFDGAFNLWGLATRKQHQQKGLMADLVRLMMREIRVPIYLQVLEGSITHHYFKRALNAQEIATERRYEIR